MSHHLHFDELAPSNKLPNLVIFRGSRDTAGMDDRESQVPLLGTTATGTSNHLLEDDSRAVSERYGTIGAKNGCVATVIPEDEESRNGSDDDVSISAHGVQQADAINLVWTRSALILAYSFIWFCSFAQALQWQIISSLTPYVTSEFSSHSLLPTIGIISSILSGVLKLPISRIIDAWGRPQGLTAMVVLATIGLILMAACQNVKTYAAAQVFYAVGLSGFTYVLDVIVADTSSLKNRAIAFGFQSTPNLITTFIGPPIARAFYEKSSWRWAFGASSVIFFMFSLPILAILMVNARKALRLGVLHEETERPNLTLSSIGHYLTEYDAIGIALLGGGLFMILIPVSLGVKREDHRDIILLVAGLTSLVTFAIHEKFTAKCPVIASSLLFSRNIAGSCLVSILIFVSYYSWDSYYGSYLQVVHGLTITEAGWLDHIYGVGSCLWAVIVGYLIRRTDRFKWCALSGLPIYNLGGFLMIFFRRPETPVGFLIMCQIMMTLGGSTLVVCNQIAVMTACTHAELASAMAVVSLAVYIGSAGGNALSGAIWNSTLPQGLAEQLPNLSPEELKQLASSMTKQLSYPMGHPIRQAIIAAYDKAQVRMCITGTIVSCLLIVAVSMWKDAKVSESKQVKGKVL